MHVPSRTVKHQNDLRHARGQSPVSVPLGITSVYWWEGKVNKDQETLMMIKTRAALVTKLTTWVKKEHPYDEVEVIGLPITGGSSSYIQWVLDSTKSG